MRIFNFERKNGPKSIRHFFNISAHAERRWLIFGIFENFLVNLKLNMFWIKYSEKWDIHDIHEYTGLLVHTQLYIRRWFHTKISHPDCLTSRTPQKYRLSHENDLIRGKINYFISKTIKIFRKKLDLGIKFGTQNFCFWRNRSVLNEQTKPKPFELLN